MTALLTDDFTLGGVEVSLDQAEALKAQGERLIADNPGPFAVNLSSLERANSVTVALLLAWYRAALLQKKSIVFTELSQDLSNIIEFSGLSRVLLPQPPAGANDNPSLATPS